MRSYLFLIALLSSLELQASVPVITSFDPIACPAGSLVTIHGSGFDPVATSNLVHFGGVNAPVVTAGSTQLVVTVPGGATYAPISVTVGGLTGFSRLPFMLTAMPQSPISPYSFAPSVDLPTGAPMRLGTLADLDGDGKLDIVGTSDRNVLTVFRNLSTAGNISTASFASVINVPTGLRTYTVVAGDLDGDGKLDLVAANNSSETVTVVRNVSTFGNLSFSVKDLVTGVGSTMAAVIADLNLDGRPDIIASGDYGFCVFRNTTVGDTILFDAAQGFATPNGCHNIAAGDIDGDGLPDVVVANGPSFVSVFRNTSTPGTISFASSVDVGGLSAPWSVALGDVDGDGRLDVVTGSNEYNSVHVLRNIGSVGDIVFAPPVALAPGSLSWDAALADLDGDGKVDLAVPPTNLSKVSVFVNAGALGAVDFREPLAYMTGGMSMGINIGDLDGDGLADLVVGNFYSGNSISVLQRLPARPVQVLVQPSTVTFDGVRVGMTDTLALQVSNVGQSDTLRVASIVSSSSIFTVFPSALVVPPTTTQSVFIRYTPLAARKDTAELSIASNDSLLPTVHVSLLGSAYELTHAPLIRNIQVLPYDYSHARVIWYRSIDDSVGAQDPATQYSLWRRVPEGGSPGSPSESTPPELHAMLTSDPAWDFVETVPAIGLERYAALVPIQVTRAAWHVFMVVVQTKGLALFQSPPDSVEDPVGYTSVNWSGGSPVPRDFVIEQNFPNPFNPTTTLHYGLPRKAFVSLTVYNSVGQTVDRLLDGEEEAGYHEIRFDGSQLASGVYFCRLNAGGFMKTIKLLLVR